MKSLGDLMVIVLMGVSGAGKTTVGLMLADQLGWEFHDADDLHSAENKRKMAHGTALSDADREPWLAKIRDLIATCLANGIDAVLACSALKQSYRDRITIDPARVKVVYLKGTEELIAQRIAHRSAHFMPADLLESQIETLEEPRDGIVVEISATPESIVRDIRDRLRI
jgi:gluconokinase